MYTDMYYVVHMCYLLKVLGRHWLCLRFQGGGLIGLDNFCAKCTTASCFIS